MTRVVLLLLMPCLASPFMWLAGDQSAYTQPPGRDLRPAAVRVQVFVDQRRNAIVKKTAEDDGFPAYVYRMRPNNQRLELRLESEEIMQRWKGNFTLGQQTTDDFEDVSQFPPVQLVVDVSNEGNAITQVAASFLEVDLSMTDNQPFIQLPVSEIGPGPNFELVNYGWGRAENAELIFAFGRDKPVSESFTLALGTLGAVEVIPTRALTAISPVVPALQRQRPKCRSTEMVPQCLQQLGRTTPLGRLASMVYVRDAAVVTRIHGKLSYQWRDHTNSLVRREHAVNAEVMVFEFDTGEGAEMGAGAPAETGFKTVTLPLDRKQYRVTLPFRPRVGPRGNSRFELTLDALKSSQHSFRVVMELTDGGRAVSPPIDLLYFRPQLDFGPSRQVK